MINFKDEFMRLCSYPRYWGAEKSLLAMQGFYYSGTDMTIVCAFCQAILNMQQIDIEAVRGMHNDENCRQGKLEGNEVLGPVNNFKCEKSRLSSFILNKWNYPVDPNGLASSGFYWTGYYDQVRCEFCGLEVMDWEIGDTGEDAHQTFNPECSFLKGQPVGNVPFELRNPDERIARHFFKQRVEAESMNLSPFGNIEELTEAITPSQKAVFPGFAAPVIRLKSFSMWPKGLGPQPNQLADAGFFYTGKGDRVMCFQCGGGLTNWDENLSPWTEHALWFPTCTFVGIMKGMQFVEQVHREALELIQREGNNTSNNEDVEKLELKHEEEEKSYRVQNAGNNAMMCKLCEEKEIRTVCLPCGHMTCCQKCAPKLENCLLCGKNVATSLTIYL